MFYLLSYTGAGTIIFILLKFIKVFLLLAALTELIIFVVYFDAVNMSDQASNRHKTRFILVFVFDIMLIIVSICGIAIQAANKKEFMKLFAIIIFLIGTSQVIPLAIWSEDYLMKEMKNAYKFIQVNDRSSIQNKFLLCWYGGKILSSFEIIFSLMQSFGLYKQVTMIKQI